jgi:hypothetical protein
LQPAQPSSRQILEEFFETAPSYYHVMRAEREPDFLIAAFCKQKLAPWQHKRPLQENYFQIRA